MKKSVKATVLNAVAKAVFGTAKKAWSSLQYLDQSFGLMYTNGRIFTFIVILEV